MEKKDLRCFTQKVCKHVTLFDPLRDGHDYFDEVMGATLLPVALSLTSIGLLTASLCEGIMALFIQTNVIENDDKTHGQRAGIYLFSALLVSILSYATFLKSAASLITRPLVTVFQGCKEQDIPRFYY